MPTLPVPKDGGGDWEAPSDGLHLAICYSFIEFGSHQENYQGKPKKGLTPKILLRWEMCDEDAAADANGVIMPKTIGKRYTWSMGENAALRKDLEAWRGAPFEPADFGEAGFNILKLIGVPCMLQITTTQKGDKSYTDISAITNIYKGIDRSTLKLKHKPIIVALNDKEWDGNAFDGLSDRMKELIKASPEYQALMRGRAGSDYKQQSQGEAAYSPGRYKTDDPALNETARRRREEYARQSGSDFPGDSDRTFGNDDLNDEIPF